MRFLDKLFGKPAAGTAGTAKRAAVQEWLCLDCRKMISGTPPRALRRCGDCNAKAAAKEAAERAVFEAAMADGSWYRAGSLDAAGDPAQHVDTGAPWRLADYLKETGKPLESFISKARNTDQGEVYAGTDKTHYLCLEWAGANAVVSVLSGADNPDQVHVYAAVPDNLSAQVAAADHATQGCPCCGVGMLWHVSRAHMPKAQAIAVFEAALAHDYTAAHWYEMPDLTRVTKGKG